MTTTNDENKAESMLKNAAEKAALLLKDAAEKASHLPLDAAEKAALMTMNAAEKAAQLPLDAAEKAALLLKETTERNMFMPAEIKAALVLKDAAEQACLMPKDSVSKMTELLNDATRKAVLIIKEEAEELTAKKNKFLDLAAHELRNPITSISLLLKVAEKQIEAGQPVAVNVLERLRGPVDRLVRLVVDLLDMSNLERGTLVLVKAKTNIVSLISQCLEEFQIQASERNFIFNKPSESIELNIDPLRINQVLSNFLDNAIKYTHRGDIEVSLVEMSQTVRISVIDHGEGIHPEKLSSLFTTFFRGSSDVTVQTSGLGLGLSVCKGIIELHHGTIGVLSEVGKGSAFYFDLPKMDGAL